MKHLVESNKHVAVARIDDQSLNVRNTFGVANYTIIISLPHILADWLSTSTQWCIDTTSCYRCTLLLPIPRCILFLMYRTLLIFSMIISWGSCSPFGGSVCICCLVCTGRLIVILLLLLRLCIPSGSSVCRSCSTSCWRGTCLSIGSTCRGRSSIFRLICCIQFVDLGLDIGNKLWEYGLPIVDLVFIHLQLVNWLSS